MHQVINWLTQADLGELPEGLRDLNQIYVGHYIFVDPDRYCDEWRAFIDYMNRLYNTIVDQCDFDPSEIQYVLGEPYVPGDGDE